MSDDPPEQREQVAGRGGEHAGIAQVDLPLRLARILILDHLVDRAVGAGEDAAILGGIVGAEADHHRRRPVRAVEAVEHPRHRLGLDQRRVAVEDQHVAVEIGELRLGLEHRMGGAELLVLDDEVAAARLDQPLDLVAPGADDDDLARRAEPLEHAHEMVEHRPAGDRVEHLVDVGHHPCALAGGEDDGGEGSGPDHDAGDATERAVFP